MGLITLPIPILLSTVLGRTVGPPQEIDSLTAWALTKDGISDAAYRADNSVVFDRLPMAVTFDGFTNFGNEAYGFTRPYKPRHHNLYDNPVPHSVTYAAVGTTVDNGDGTFDLVTAIKAVIQVNGTFVMNSVYRVDIEHLSGDACEFASDVQDGGAFTSSTDTDSYSLETRSVYCIPDSTTQITITQEDLSAPNATVRPAGVFHVGPVPLLPHARLEAWNNSIRNDPAQAGLAGQFALPTSEATDFSIFFTLLREDLFGTADFPSIRYIIDLNLLSMRELFGANWAITVDSQGYNSPAYSIDVWHKFAVQFEANASKYSRDAVAPVDMSAITTLPGMPKFIELNWTSIGGVSVRAYRGMFVVTGSLTDQEKTDLMAFLPTTA